MTGDRDVWTLPQVIAARWRGLTAERVTKVARFLGFDGLSQHTRYDGLALSYSPAAVGLIERELRSRGERVTQAEVALTLARPAMWKVQHAGSHEQDRWDAMAWLEMFGAKEYSRCTCAKCEKLWAGPGLASAGSNVGLVLAEVSHG